MERTMIFCGLCLCGVSLVAGSLAPAKDLVAFVPMLTGIPLFFLGVIGLNPHRRRAAAWIGLILACLGFFFAITRLFQIGVDQGPVAQFERWICAAMLLTTSSFCVLVGLALRRLPRRPLVNKTAEGSSGPKNEMTSA